MAFTFEVQWPAPFKSGWQTSGQRLETIEQAAKEMAKFAAVSLENGHSMKCRLIEVKE